jgi:hypothetical protein
MSKIEAVTRRIVGNRRTHRRKRFIYTTTVRNERGQVIFKGKTINLSRAGARLAGFPNGTGPVKGQTVQVEFLVIPKDASRISRVAVKPARIWRIDDREGAFSLAVKFEREFPE